MLDVSGHKLEPMYKADGKRYTCRECGRIASEESDKFWIGVSCKSNRWNAEVQSKEYRKWEAVKKQRGYRIALMNTSVTVRITRRRATRMETNRRKRSCGKQTERGFKSAG